MEDITKRFISIYEYLIENNFVKNASDFAKTIDVSSSLVNEILKGRSNPGTKIIQNTVKKFDFFDLEWLILGKKSIIKSNNIDFSSDLNILLKERASMIELQKKYIKTLEDQLNKSKHYPEVPITIHGVAEDQPKLK